MYKSYLTLILLSLFSFSCAKGKLEVPETIKKLTDKNADCTCEPYINQYTWESKTIYVLAYKEPSCDWKPTYYNEKGEEIKMGSGYHYDKFLEDSRLIKNIWTCKK
ncbi:MAG: hypothetical protein WKF68_00510 [Daejeonella sp.]